VCARLLYTNKDTIFDCEVRDDKCLRKGTVETPVGYQSLAQALTRPVVAFPGTEQGSDPPAGGAQGSDPLAGGAQGSEPPAGGAQGSDPPAGGALADLLERLRSIDTTPQVQAGDYVCRWEPPHTMSALAKLTHADGTVTEPGAICAPRSHGAVSDPLPEGSVRRDYTSDLSCIAAQTAFTEGGVHICAPTLAESLTTLMHMGDMSVLHDVNNKHRGVNQSLERLTVGLASAIAEVDTKHMGVTQAIGSLTTGLDAATAGVAELNNRHMGVTNSIGSLTTGLDAATAGGAELNNRHMGVTDSIGSLTMGFEAATSAIAELSLRVDAHMS